MKSDFLIDFEKKMKGALRILREDLATIRVGRANPAMLEGTKLDVYEGSQSMELEELGTILVEGPRTLVFNPFDPSVIDEIERGLRGANLGLQVVPKEEKIWLNLPSLTEERRQEYLSLAGKKIEGGRIVARQVRKRAMQDVKKRFDNEEISEDEKYRLEKEIQKVTDKIMDKIQQIGEKKEKEIKTV